MTSNGQSMRLVYLMAVYCSWNISWPRLPRFPFRILLCEKILHFEARLAHANANVKVCCRDNQVLRARYVISPWDLSESAGLYNKTDKLSSWRLIKGATENSRRYFYLLKFYLYPGENKFRQNLHSDTQISRYFWKWLVFWKMKESISWQISRQIQKLVYKLTNCKFINFSKFVEKVV